jgi:hypothetical protein
MTAARDVYRVAGSPPMEGCEDVAAACVVCARNWPRTHAYKRWQGANYTDQNKLMGHGLSDRICEPCVFVHSWVAPPGYPPAEPGKKGVNLRLFSHLHDERGYLFANKGNKPLIRDWLRAPKHGAWWAAIADSGQKHVLPWARVNAPRHRGAGIVRFEQRDVEIGDWALVDVMTAALTAGVTKADIETGQYTSRSWQLAEELVRRLEREHGHARGGGWWELALWLSQRDEVASAERMALEKETRDARRTKSGRGQGRSGDVAARGARGVPRERRESDEALGPVAGPTCDVVADERQRGADGVELASRAESLGPQLQLF